MIMKVIIILFVSQLFNSAIANTLEKLSHEKLDNVIAELNQLKSNYTAEVNKLHSDFINKSQIFQKVTTKYRADVKTLKFNYELKLKEKLITVHGWNNGGCAPFAKLSNKQNDCDFRSLAPMKDCLEFYRQGFRMSGVYKIH